LELLRPDSAEAAAAALGNGSIALAGGTEVVPLLRDGIVHADKLIELRDAVPRGVDGERIGAGTTLAELEANPEIPQALREASSLAASPQLRSMSTIGGNLLQATRCWYWRLKFPCYLHGGEVCHAKAGQHREHAIRQRALCVRAPVRPGSGACGARRASANDRTGASARRALPAADR
jgi:xanthine dehydrogenase YagS FAD-binding subunit